MELRFETPMPTGSLHLADGSEAKIIGGSVEVLAEIELCSGQTLLTPLRRASDGEVVGLHGLADLQYPSESFKALVVATPEGGDWSNLTMRVMLLDPAGDVIPLPAGAQLSLVRIPLSKAAAEP